MQKIAVIYARVSGDKQKKEETIESQLAACLKYAQDNNYTVPEGWIFKDDGCKGSSLKRPSLDMLRDVVKENIPDAVIVLCPDRLARKVASQYVLEEEFKKAGVNLLFLDQPNTNTPEEKMSVHFRAIFAEYEREKILERCRRGRNHKAREGNLSVLPSAPFGYDYIPKIKGGKAQYEINDKKSVVVKQIFNMFTIENFPLLKICRQLDADGILTPSGKNSWDHTTLRDILLNSAYTGIAYFGKTERCEIATPQRTMRTKTGKVFKNSTKYRQARNKEDWIEILTPAFIDESQFNMAQELLKTNKEYAARNTKRPSILQGLLICKTCGLPLYKKGRGKHVYYCCRSKLERKISNCGASNIRQDILDDLIWGEVIDLLKNPKLITIELNKRIQDGLKNDSHEKRRDDLHRDLKKINIQRDKLLDAYQQGDCLTLEEFSRRIKNLNKEKETLENCLESYKASEIMQKSHDEILTSLDRCVEMINSSSDTLGVGDKQKILRLLIDEIIVGNEDIVIKHCIPLNKKTDKECPLLGDRYDDPSGLATNLKLILSADCEASLDH